MLSNGSLLVTHLYMLIVLAFVEKGLSAQRLSVYDAPVDLFRGHAEAARHSELRATRGLAHSHAQGQLVS